MKIRHTNRYRADSGTRRFVRSSIHQLLGHGERWRGSEGLGCRYCAPEPYCAALKERRSYLSLIEQLSELD